ncbi:ornithine cyclodeaminase [Paraoerskovia sediminicola]|uniref:Ornithine cyclodeaminase n=1 Tax=Paraoerskovia sediminicola TaxID=1138587 RepID=A0ABM8FZZ3_9CELL|nr:ornithine cyclodeaminase family protein [Paraoerskovia sediminicola]BDZ41403.1 ornithine cyclodeaminase [Paraoerskovia sediminicola]
MIDAVDRAHRALRAGTAHQPPVPVAATPGADAHFLAMTAVSDDVGLAGSKLLADIPGNRQRGLPTQRSVVVLADSRTGACEGVLHGAIPTRLRTAATTAVATRALARPGSTVVGLVGAGALAVEHVDMLAEVLPLEQVVVWTRRDATFESFAARVAERRPGVKVTRADSARTAVEAADVLCTLTPSREPVVEGAWFHAGLHVNAVGSPPRPDHREVDSAAMAVARIVVDTRESALHESGEVALAIADGAITADDCRTDLADVLTGALVRTGPDDITLFNSVGLGIQDVAIGRLLLDAARERGVGLELDLSA